MAFNQFNEFLKELKSQKQLSDNFEPLSENAARNILGLQQEVKNTKVALEDQFVNIHDIFNTLKSPKEPINPDFLKNYKNRSYALTNQNNFFWKYEKNYIL